MDKRIEKLISLVPPGLSVIDIGTDHGLVAMGLAGRSDIKRVMATDISFSCLNKLVEALQGADEDIRNKISYKLTDGLIGLEDEEGDLILIAGMGGNLIMEILEKSMTRALKSSYWLLSPQSNIEEFRFFLSKMPYEIEEDICKEAGHFYPLFLVKLKEKRSPTSPYNEKLSKYQLIYGPNLIKNRDPLIKEMIERDLLNSTLIEKNILFGGGGDEALEKVRDKKRELSALLEIWDKS